MPRIDSVITNYESILWLYPYTYGIRIRDGKWIDARKRNAIYRIMDYDINKLSYSGNIGDIIYDIDIQRAYVYGRYGNRLLYLI